MKHFLKAQLLGLGLLLQSVNIQAQADSWEWLHKVDNKYQNVHWVADDVIAASIEPEGFWQLINNKGELISPVYFYAVPVLSEGLIVFSDSLEQFGAMDKSGKVIIKPQFEHLGDFKQGLALAAIGNQFAYIDRTGQKTEQVRTAIAYEFVENKAIKWENERCYFIDTAGNRLFGKQDFQTAEPFNEGLAAVKNNELWAFINDKGALISKFEFNEVSSFSNGAAVVKQNGKAGLIDKKGAWIIKPIYYAMWSMPNGYFGVSDKGGQWVVDNKGKKVSKQQYQQVIGYPNGLFRFQIQDKYHIGNLDGKILVEDINHSVSEFGEFIAVGKGDKFAFINAKGQLLGDKWFDSIGNFVNGIGVIQENGKLGIIDKTGKQRTACIFEELWLDGDGSIWAKMGDTQGFIGLK